MLSKLESLEEKLKALLGITACRTIDIGDLYLFPNLVFPSKFEPPKCEMYDGNISPIMHLTIYTCNKAAHIKNKKLMVYYFQ